MQKTSSTTSRLFAAFVLALVLALAGQASLTAYEGYGTGNCSLWQKFQSWWSGVYCEYL